MEDLQFSDPASKGNGTEEMPKKPQKRGRKGLVVSLAVALAVVGGILLYSYQNNAEAPPTLSQEASYQGLIQEQDNNFFQVEQSDVDAFNQADATGTSPKERLQQEHGEAGTPISADIHFYYATEDISIKQIYEQIDPVLNNKLFVAYFDAENGDEFKVLPEGPFVGTRTVEETFTIPAYRNFILISRYDTTAWGFQAETDFVTEFRRPIPHNESGWVSSPAMQDMSQVFEVFPSIDFVWAMDSPNSFTFIEPEDYATTTNLTTYSPMWIKWDTGPAEEDSIVVRTDEELVDDGSLYYRYVTTVDSYTTLFAFVDYIEEFANNNSTAPHAQDVIAATVEARVQGEEFFNTFGINFSELSDYSENYQGVFLRENELDQVERAVLDMIADMEADFSNFDQGPAPNDMASVFRGMTQYFSMRQYLDFVDSELADAEVTSLITEVKDAMSAQQGAQVDFRDLNHSYVEDFVDVFLRSEDIEAIKAGLTVMRDNFLEGAPDTTRPRIVDLLSSASLYEQLLFELSNIREYVVVSIAADDARDLQETLDDVGERLVRLRGTGVEFADLNLNYEQIFGALRLDSNQFAALNSAFEEMHNALALSADMAESLRFMSGYSQLTDYLNNIANNLGDEAINSLVAQIEVLIEEIRIPVALTELDQGYIDLFVDVYATTDYLTEIRAGLEALKATLELEAEANAAPSDLAGVLTAAASYQDLRDFLTSVDEFIATQEETLRTRSILSSTETINIYISEYESRELVPEYPSLDHSYITHFEGLELVTEDIQSLSTALLQMKRTLAPQDLRTTIENIDNYEDLIALMGEIAKVSGDDEAVNSRLDSETVTTINHLMTYQNNGISFNGWDTSYTRNFSGKFLISEHTADLLTAVQEMNRLLTPPDLGDMIRASVSYEELTDLVQTMGNLESQNQDQNVLLNETAGAVLATLEALQNNGVAYNDWDTSYAGAFNDEYLNAEDISEIIVNLNTMDEKLTERLEQ